MSALGGLPGFAYPELSFGETELLAPLIAPVTNPGSDPFVFPLIVAQDGYALNIRQVRMICSATGAVGNRTTDLVMQDADGNNVGEYRNPIVTAPGLNSAQTWMTTLSAPYTQGNAGFAPMLPIILVAGYRVTVFVFGTNVGDNWTQISVLGEKIPMGRPASVAVPVTAPVLLT